MDEVVARLRIVAGAFGVREDLLFDEFSAARLL